MVAGAALLILGSLLPVSHCPATSFLYSSSTLSFTGYLSRVMISGQEAEPSVTQFLTYVMGTVLPSLKDCVTWSTSLTFFTSVINKWMEAMSPGSTQRSACPG